jgi:hypothetical protein
MTERTKVCRIKLAVERSPRWPRCPRSTGTWRRGWTCAAGHLVQIGFRGTDARGVAPRLPFLLIILPRFDQVAGTMPNLLSMRSASEATSLISRRTFHRARDRIRGNPLRRGSGALEQRNMSTRAARLLARLNRNPDSDPAPLRESELF